MSITSHYNDVTETQIEIQLLNFSKLSNDSRNTMCKKPTCSPNFTSSDPFPQRVCAVKVSIFVFTKLSQSVRAPEGPMILFEERQSV